MTTVPADKEHATELAARFFGAFQRVDRVRPGRTESTDSTHTEGNPSAKIPKILPRIACSSIGGELFAASSERCKQALSDELHATAAS